MKWLLNKKKDGKRVFISSVACKMCHRHEYTIWKKSGHSHAFSKSLKKANKTFDPECLMCHTTGFKEDGGFMSEDTTPELIDVQCEACHGAANNHAADSSKAYGETSKDVCMTCHTRENSPGYKFSAYWGKIKH